MISNALARMEGDETEVWMSSTAASRRKIFGLRGMADDDEMEEL